MQLAERVMRLKPSATLAVNALAQELKSAGRKILSLSVGEPDFNTPVAIGDAGIAAIKGGSTKYTAESGTQELRLAVAGYFKRLYGAEAGAEHIIVSNGGKQCLFNLFLALFNPGDEVLVPAPYWVSYPPMLELAGAEPVIVPTGVEKSFKVSVEDLERHYTAKTRACIINSPSNPTGMVYTEAEIAAIADWAVQRRVLIISDEIYDQLIYGGKGHHSFCRYWNRHPEYFVVVNGVSKTFAMTGWRLGYMLAHPDIIKAAGKLQGQSTSAPSSISQKAALAALTLPVPEVDAMRQAFERRCKLVTDAINLWPGVFCPLPQGAFYVFPDMHKLYGNKFSDSASLCTYLLEKAEVAVVPGVAFGDDNCIRLSYATDEATLGQALERMSKALFT